MISNIKIILNFALNDLKKRYAGSIGGILWAFVQPLVSILVFWFVFEVGFKNPPVDDMNFILWLVPAYISWNFASDVMLQASNVLYEYSYLVKKVKFNILLLPIIKVISAFFIHLFFIGFCYILFLIYGYSFHIAWIQVFYYSLCLIFLLVGLSWLLSSLSVFWKDIVVIINIILQIGFWMVPVFWNPVGMNEKIVKILKLNPFYYIVNGYRECFTNHSFFGNYQILTPYYWLVSGIVLIVGLVVFKRLAKHYADLL